MTRPPPFSSKFPIRGEKNNGKRKLSRDLSLKAKNGQRVALSMSCVEQDVTGQPKSTDTESAGTYFSVEMFPYFIMITK